MDSSARFLSLSFLLFQSNNRHWPSLHSFLISRQIKGEEGTPGFSIVFSFFFLEYRKIFSLEIYFCFPKDKVVRVSEKDGLRNTVVKRRNLF